MNDHELDRTLRAIGGDRTRVSVPPSLRVRVHAVPLGADGDGGFLPHITWRFLDMFSATKLVVGGAVAGLIGIVFLSGTLTSPEPSTPGAAPSASPTPVIHWTTPVVDLSADAFSVEANDLVFTTEGTEPQARSDPGGPDYWTLEVEWTEQDLEQRLYMYFGSDGSDWWVDEIRTRDGYDPAEWIYAYGPFFTTPLGEAYEGDVRIDLVGSGRPGDPDNRVPGVLTIEGMRLTPTAGGSDALAESPVTTVSLGLYSGRPDPSWQLSEEESATLTALLESLPRVDGSPPSGGLGYHGFGIERLTPEGMPRLLVAFEGTVSDPDTGNPSYLDDPARSVEHFLLDSGRDRLSAAEIMAAGLDPAPTSGTSPLGGTWTAVSVPGIEITEGLEAPRVQFTVGGRILAVTNCYELILPFSLEGERVSLGQLEVPATGDCTPRDLHIDTAFAAVLLSADTIVGGLPSDRLTISGPLGEIILAQPAAQSE